MQNKFDDFEQALNSDLSVAVVTITEAAAARVLSGAQLGMLLEALTEGYPGTFAKASSNTASTSDDPEYGADFDLTEEVNAQIRVVRSLRNMIMDPATGAIKDGYTARDAKELIGSSNTMLASLMKFHEKIVNQDRLRAVEHATVEIVKTLSQEAQDSFFSELEKALLADR